MDGLWISELAERSGFSPSALRFYEQAGLLPQPDRTPGGYRSYGEDTVDRLRFITRAKQLGLPLEEIRELTAVWDTGDCAPLQHRLTDLLSTKITEVEQRITELTAFHVQLTAARAEIGQRTPDGPCDDRCGCLAQPGAAAVAGPQPVQLLTTTPVTRPPRQQ